MTISTRSRNRHRTKTMLCPGRMNNNTYSAPPNFPQKHINPPANPTSPSPQTQPHPSSHRKTPAHPSKKKKKKKTHPPVQTHKKKPPQRERNTISNPKKKRERERDHVPSDQLPLHLRPLQDAPLRVLQRLPQMRGQ